MRVYVIAGGGGGFCKVGKTSNIKRRLKELQDSSPFNLKIRHQTEEVSPTIAAAIECDAHQLLDLKGVTRRGEWFKCPWDVAVRHVIMAAKEYEEGPAPKPAPCIGGLILQAIEKLDVEGWPSG